MMRLSEHLFAWKHDSAYMDWYEKALYNHILGQQEPETGAKNVLCIAFARTPQSI